MKSIPRWALALAGAFIGLAFGFYLAGSPTQGQNPVLRSPAVPRELTSYRDIVKGVLPGVVSIEAKAKPRPAQPPARPRPPVNGIPKDYQRFFEEGDRPPVPEDGSLGFGSGFVVDATGIILTNYHVVEDAEELDVHTADGRKYVTRDFTYDRASDLAVVRIKPVEPLTVLAFGDSDAMEIGDRVLALGAPFGLKGSVTHGIVSGKSRSLRLNVYEDFIQTDAAVNPGNSGGPLINLEGKVVGINSAIKTRSGGFQGVGLAITSNHARRILTQLVKNGVVRRGYIGAIVDDLDPDTRQKLGIRGAITRRVLAKSPADRAGLKVGDIITKLGGQPLQDSRDLQRIVAEQPLDEPVELEILRNGKAYRLPVTITAHPDNESPRK